MTTETVTEQRCLPAQRTVAIPEVAPANPLAGLPGRPLDESELRALAAAVAADRSLWAEHVAFDDDRRHYASLYRDDHVDVWVLCWTATNDTGWHDHDVSAGAVAVTAGLLREQNLVIGGTATIVDVPAGLAYAFGPEHIHRLSGAINGSVSIHVYSPPLVTLGQYSINADGVLRRTIISYTDELRSQAPESELTASD